MSFYRKYRPQNFDNLVGQNHVSLTLSNALKLGRVSHAYLFTGPRGTGKTTTARIMAKSVNCLNLKDGTPCEECEICKDINEGRLIDVIEIDAASNRGIDEMRDLKEKINFAPTRARNKVYIIDEVHMLTKEAFNALLKTLEEPPASVFFILATTEVHKVPETILSRCQRFDFRRIDMKTLVERLKFIAAQEGIEAEDKALEMIADHAQGGMRDAIGLMEQISTGGKLTYENVCSVLGVSGYASMEKLYGFLQAGDAAGGLNEVHALHEEGFDLLNFNKNFLEYLRKRMLESVEKNERDLTGKLLGWIEFFQQAYEQARHTPIAQLPLEVAVVEAVFGAPSILNSAATKPAAAQAPAYVQAPAITPPAASHVQHISTTQSPPIIADQPASSPPVMERKHGGIESGEEASITVDELKKKWPEVIKRVKIPAAKQALMQGKIAGMNSHDLSLHFSTKFYLEKIKEPANHVDIENAIFEATGVQVKVMPELRTIENAPAMRAEKGFQPADPLTSNALEIFGGEMVS